MLLGDQVFLCWSSFALVFSQIVQQFSRIGKDFHLDGTLIVNNAGSSVSLAAIYNDYYKGYNYVTDPLPMKHDKKGFPALTIREAFKNYRVSKKKGSNKSQRWLLQKLPLGRQLEHSGP